MDMVGGWLVDAIFSLLLIYEVLSGLRMPKAKFKRKGAPLDVLKIFEEKDQCKFRKHNGGVIEKFKKDTTQSKILLLPEEIICIILESLPGKFTT